MKMLRAIRSNFLPNAVVILKPMGEEKPAISRLASFVEYMTAREDKATAYVCTNFNCEFPTNKVDEMLGKMNIRSEKQKEAPTLSPFDNLLMQDFFQ